MQLAVAADVFDVEFVDFDVTVSEDGSLRFHGLTPGGAWRTSKISKALGDKVLNALAKARAKDAVDSDFRDA